MITLRDFTPAAIVWTTPQPSVSFVPAHISSNIASVRAWRERGRELSSIRTLGNDWDGYGSEAPDEGVLEAADRLLGVLSTRLSENPPMRLSLAPDGSLTVDWVEGKALLQAAIQESGTEIEWMRAIPGKPTEFLTQKLENPVGSGIQQVQMWQPTQPEEELDLAFAH